MQKASLIFFLSLLPIFVLGQEKVLTPTDAAGGALYPEAMDQLQWQGQSNHFSWVDDENNLMQSDARGNERILVTLEQLNGLLSEPLPRFPRVTWQNDEAFLFSTGDGVYRFDVVNGRFNTLLRYDDSPEATELSASDRIAVVKDHNIYVSDPKSATLVQVTTDGTHDLVYGEAAHRSEFGIRKGLFWDEQGEYLAFYRMDQSMVTDYPFVNNEEIPAQYNPVKYPMAGGVSHYVTVGIYHPKTKEIVYLERPEGKDWYLTNITWSPDGKQLYIAVINRDQNHMWLKRYNARTGTIEQVLFEETHDKYVEPEHGPVFLPGQPDRFLWFSERDGYQHLYLYDTAGNLHRQLTRGEWEVSSLLGFDEKKNEVFIQTTKASPLERQIYAVAIKNGKMRRITAERGNHNARLSGDGSLLLDTWSSLNTPGKSELLNAQSGKVQQTLLTAANPLSGYVVGSTSIDSLQARDGTWLYTRTILPPDFDAAKKYPAIVYTYAGPHAQLVQNRWLGGSSLFLQYLASKGYVIYTLDSRGSGGRGLGFEQSTFRKLGDKEIADQVMGAGYLKNLPYIDSSRVGIHGWSYGGFMTTSLMLRTPGTFKVGVCGGPVIDWKYYEVMYTERYMDTPEQNPDGYATASLPQYVENLRGKLLIIQGLQDDVVVPQHSNSLLTESVKKNVQIDYYPYIRHKHHVRGQDRIHLLEKMANYFFENL